jgi:hypothetical protein
MNKIILFLIFILPTFGLKSQTVLMDEDVKDSDPTDVGPNKKKFGHFYVGFGSIVGPSESDSVATRPFRSYEYTFGYRFKYRISQLYSLGFDLNYNSKSYSIKQDSFKIFPNGTLHDKEKLQLRNVGVDIYNRFNYGKRGNQIGNYIDIGAYLDWSPNPTYITFDKYSIVNSVGASNTRQVHKGLIYVNPINYGLLARIGFNKFSFYGSYRLTDIFYKNYIYTELPRIIAGIQIGLHK